MQPNVIHSSSFTLILPTLPQFPYGYDGVKSNDKVSIRLEYLVRVLVLPGDEHKYNWELISKRW